MAKIAEKLLILGDISAGLQCRLHFISNFKKPQIFEGKEMEKLIKRFQEKFPAKPDDEQKYKEFDNFKKRSVEFVSALADYYNTFMDVVNFTEEAFKLLQETAQANLQDKLKFEVNPDLQSYYMQLLVRYVSVQLLCEQIVDPQLYLACYARAYHLNLGNTEANVGRIHAYLTRFRGGQGALRKLQEECATLSGVVGPTLSSLFPIIKSYSESSSSIIDSKLFNITDDPHKLRYPSNEKQLNEVTQLDKLRTWVIYGYLVCPSQLAAPGALDLMKMCLKDSFQVPIFRERTMDAVKNFDVLFDWYKDGKFKLSKNTKFLKESVEWEFTVSYHAALRTYLRLSLNQLYFFFTSQPACIPPKISVIFALLKLSRDEVVWYFRHLSAQPFKPKNKYVPQADAFISELVHGVVQFVYLLKTYKNRVQQYYLEYLSLDLPKLDPVAREFMNGPHTSSQLNTLLQCVLDNLSGRSLDDNFESIRLNWYRISAILTAAPSAAAQQSSLPLCNIMNTVVAHTRNIDMIDSQLRAHASFSSLFWYRAELFDMLRDSIKGTAGQPRHCMSFLRVMHDASHNVHRICPEEQQLIGKESLTAGDSYLRHITGQLERYLVSILNDHHLFRKQLSTGAVLKRLADQAAATAANQSSSSSSSSSSSQETSKPLPGHESLYVNRAQLANPRVTKKVIAELAAAYQNIDTITVYNLQFAPKEYLLDMINSFIRTSLRSAAFPSGANMAYPTRILKAFTETCGVLSHIQRQVNVNVDDLVRDVLICEMTEDETVGEVLVGGNSSSSSSSSSPSSSSSSSSTSENSGDKKEKVLPLIHHIATFYYVLFQGDISEHGITYSPLRRCFLSRHNVSSASPAPTSSSAPVQRSDIERYTDAPELCALMQLCGPSGFAVIDKVMLRLVCRSVKSVKENLVQNQTVLTSLFGKFSEQSLWNETVDKIQGIDSLVSAVTSAGVCLHFRQLLFDALSVATSEHVPYFHKAAAAALTHAQSRLLGDPQLTNLEASAVNFGFNTGNLPRLSSFSPLLNEADISLRSALSKFKTSNADGQSLYLLPELFSLAYLSSRWKHATYAIDAEGHVNNVHCSALAVTKLIAGFARIQVKSDANYGDVEKRIQHDMERWLRNSSYSILHLHGINERLKKGETVTIGGQNLVLPEYPISSIAVFLEQLILSCSPRLSLSMLEDCYPFTLLRTNFIQMYEKTTQHAFAPVADDNHDTF